MPGEAMLTLPGLGVSNQFPNGFGRKRWIDHQDLGQVDNACDRSNVADEIVTEFLVECRVDRRRRVDQEQRIAVRRCAHHRFGADGVAATRPVLGNEWLAEPIRERLPDQAREDVGRTAGALSDDYAHWPRWVALCASNARHDRQRGGAAGEMQKSATGKFYLAPSLSRYSITSSARASSDGGTSRPSALAVL
jgi:hypothetical protein